MSGRLPDFIIIGAMKAATTTAYWWLDRHPDTSLPAVKEPDFFCVEENYAKGLDHYRAGFAGAPAGTLTGEASVKYTAPDTAERCAARIAADLPQVKLVAILRDPVERLRSEYRFARQRGWDQRDLLSAVTAPGNPYVAKSCYFACLEPYLSRFDGSRLAVLHTEDLHATGTAWRSLLEFLDLAYISPPEEIYNQTDALPQMRPIHRVLDRPPAKQLIAVLPARLRRAGRWAITDRNPSASAERRRDSEQALPQSVLDTLAADASRLAAALDWPTVPWAALR